MAERALAHELTSQKEITNVLYYELLGQLHMQQKQYTSALHDFEQALVLRHEVCFYLMQESVRLLMFKYCREMLK